METNYKIKQKVWDIKISKHKNPQPYYSVRKDGVEIKETEILGISEYKIVLNDVYFTTVDIDNKDRKNRKYYRYLDDISVDVRVSGILEPGVFISLYSTKQPDKKLLQKMVKEAKKVINREYGFLFGNVIGELNQFVEEWKN